MDFGNFQSWLPNIARLAYFVAAVLFILGIKRMSSPVTARKGIVQAGWGMVIATVATFGVTGAHNIWWILGALALGIIYALFIVSRFREERARGERRQCDDTDTPVQERAHEAPQRIIERPFSREIVAHPTAPPSRSRALADHGRLRKGRLLQ